MRAILVALGVLALAATASAKTLKVPQQYATIQAAADAAADGDTIKVSKGVYSENVTVSAANLKILGKKAVIDGTIGGSYGVCLTVFGSNTLVQGFTFRHGTTQVQFYNNGCHLVKCISIDAGSYGIYIGGYNDTLVSGCRFYGSGSIAIYNGGGTSAGTFEKNLVQQSAQYGMMVYGTGAVIQKNKILDNGSSSAIYGSGGSVTIAKNKITGGEGNGIEFYGNENLVQSNTVAWVRNTGIYFYVYSGNGTVEGNKVTSAGSGIQAYGNGVQVLTNKVASTVGDTGVVVGGDNFTVTGNQVLRVVAGRGFYIYNNTTVGGGTVQDNLATDATQGGFYFNSIFNTSVSACSAVRCANRCDRRAFEVYGNGNTVDGCEADNPVGTGFYANGSSNTFTACIVKVAQVNGFENYGDSNTYSYCNASGGAGQGFNNGGTNTVMNGGVFVQNRTDITDQVGGGANFSEGGITNVIFVTGDELTEPQIYNYCTD